VSLNLRRARRTSTAPSAACSFLRQKPGEQLLRLPQLWQRVELFNDPGIFGVYPGVLPFSACWPLNNSNNSDKQ